MLSETNRQSPCYLLNPSTTTDSYGDPFNDWSNPVKTLLPNSDLQPHTTAFRAEDSDSATGTSTRVFARLVCTGNFDVYNQVTKYSRIQQGDTIWKLNGDPIMKTGLMFGSGHLSAGLERITVGAPDV